MTVTGTGSDRVLTAGFNFALFCVFPLFKEMVSCQEGVSCKHSRTCVAHNFPNSFTHCGFIAMYGTLRAGPLFGSERTFVDLPEGISQQFFTILTQPSARGSMMTMAIYPNHGRHSLFFPIQTTMSPGYVLFFKFQVSRHLNHSQDEKQEETRLGLIQHFSGGPGSY